MKLDTAPRSERHTSNNSQSNRPSTRRYESPKIECLGKLSSLIQGSTGHGRDFPPSLSNPNKPIIT